MPLDPVRAADTRAWLNRAVMDLRAASIDLAAEPPVLDDMVFHCQQAVEKSLKSLLTWHDQPFGKTHNLETLGEACLRLDPSLRALVDRAVPLTEYAWKYRYPGDHEGATRTEAEQALRVAQAVFEAVLARVHETARP